ncbi:hypothetical protein V2S66_29725 [Streptomyces sp. V4-01]|uniref:Sensor histidine kinase n=1 Tax=Actinacidiphila polyblastidii TaxID=3110430 RepID=A0ABU7PKB5_9ACTN|nr:hypothetical protein [Streptomyces sp. V4-01]
MQHRAGLEAPSMEWGRGKPRRRPADRQADRQAAVDARPADHDADVVFETAIHAARTLWRWGCWVRLALYGAAAVPALAWSPAAGLPRIVLSLLPGACGLALAFGHSFSEKLPLLARLPAAGPLVRHLLSVREKASVDASGLLEGVGILLATWLFVGPLPLSGLPAPARTAGVALCIAYNWDAVLQAVIDAGWYSVTAAPTRGMRVFRWFIPPVHGLLLVAVLWPWSAAAAEVPAGFVAALTLSPLLFYAVWAMFAAMLRAAVHTAVAQHRLARFNSASAVHSMLKNSVSVLARYAEQDDPPPDLGHLRSLSREVLVGIEEARQAIMRADPDSQSGSVREVWMRLEPLIAHAWRGRHEECELSGDVDVRLTSTDYQRVRSLMSDLMMNALKAQARRVRVEFLVQDAERPELCLLRVSDDGERFPPGAARNPLTSLKVQDILLGRYGGGIDVVDDGRWKHVAARWGCPPGIVRPVRAARPDDSPLDPLPDPRQRTAGKGA